MTYFVQLFRIVKRPIFLFFINPLILGVIGVFLTLFYNPLSNFSVLVYPPGKDATISYPKGELTLGKEIKGEFKAVDDNLGIVSVRFDNFERISADSVVFRIKEKGQSSWYYQGTYKVNQFQPNKFFPFGFPVIADSKGKAYEFEVESLHGKRGDAIGRSEQLPYFITSYQFPKHEILVNKSTVINYVFEKRVKSVLEYTDSLVSSLYYFLPFTYYLFVTLILDRLCKRRPVFAIVFVLLITGVDIFFVNSLRNDLILVIGILWVLVFLRKRIEASLLMAIAIALLFFIPLAAVLGQDTISEKVARWFYVLFLLSLLFMLIEMKRKPLTGLRKFFL